MYRVVMVASNSQLNSPRFDFDDKEEAVAWARSALDMRATTANRCTSAAILREKSHVGWREVERVLL